MTLPSENWDIDGGRTRARMSGGELMAYHHRIAAIALALALTVGVPAAAAAQQSVKPSSPASASACAEVCSGGGYASGNSTTQPTCTLPLITGYPAITVAGTDPWLSV
jgi:hypothetical protein